MEALDVLIQEALNTSGDDEVGMLHLLNSFLKSDEFLIRQNPTKLRTALRQLNPAVHSLGYLFLLEALVSGMGIHGQSEGATMDVIKFLEVCDGKQVRYSPLKFNSLTSKFGDHMMAQKKFLAAVSPLRSAVLKIRPSPEYLTVQHADLALFCLLAKTYKAAAPVLDEDVLEIDPKATGVQARDFLLYCYYGGMVYIGLKRFDRAQELLSHTLRVPGSDTSAITVAAYKKYILVSLILDGSVPSFNRLSPNISLHNLKSFSIDYVDFANVFKSGDIALIRTFLESHRDAFRADSNLGLAKQVLASLHKRNIQLLTQTYLTLSLDDIARIVRLDGPREAEAHIVRMVECGDIFASINQKDGMVRFLEDPEEYNTKAMANRLDAYLQRAISIGAKVAKFNEELSYDKNFFTRLSMRERGGGGRYVDSDDFEFGGQKLFSDIM